MADEIEILTENEAGDSWVDPTPSAVTTGYSAQNTNIEALFNGYDRFDVQYSSPNIIINISGIADDNGLPMVVKSQILIDISAQANGTYYLKIIAGSTTLKRSISLVTTPGTWDASKSGFYESGDRILDTIIIKDATGVYLARRFDNDTKGLKCEFIDTGSGPVKVGQDLRTTDAVTFLTVNTGHGDNELYPMNQDVRSTASPTFANATIASKLLSTYLGYLNQDVKTTSSPTLAGLTLNGSLLPDTTPTSDSRVFPTEDTWIPPRGVYMFGFVEPYIRVSIDGGSSYGLMYGGIIFADGSNVKIKNTSPSVAYNLYYLKF